MSRPRFLVGILAFSSGICGLALAQTNVPWQGAAQIDSAATLTSARKVMADARAAVVEVKRQLAIAREARDVIKVLCLSDNLSQLKTAERSSNERFTALQAALSSSQIERARHESTVLLALGERTSAISAEASDCIGTEANADSEGSLALQVSRSVPGVDPSSSVNRPFGNAVSPAAFGPDTISPPPVVATPID